MNPDDYDRLAQDWANNNPVPGWLRLHESRQKLEAWRRWTEHASLQQLEEWWNRQETHEQLKNMKQHHRAEIKDETLKLIQYYRGETDENERRIPEQVAKGV